MTVKHGHTLKPPSEWDRRTYRLQHCFTTTAIGHGHDTNNTGDKRDESRTNHVSGWIVVFSFVVVENCFLLSLHVQVELI